MKALRKGQGTLVAHIY